MIGAGCFGVVLKGQAYGILSTEEETVVAVKKLKETANNEVNEFKLFCQTISRISKFRRLMLW